MSEFLELDAKDDSPSPATSPANEPADDARRARADLAHALRRVTYLTECVRRIMGCVDRGDPLGIQHVCREAIARTHEQPAPSVSGLGAPAPVPCVMTGTPWPHVDLTARADGLIVTISDTMNADQWAECKLDPDRLVMAMVEVERLQCRERPRDSALPASVR